jgi:hypothetical protein
MNGNFSALLSSGFIPGWLSFALIVIWYMRTRAANRTADAKIKLDDWVRLTEWNQRLQEDCEACHKERDEWRARALKAEAASEGIGLVRTAQAIADAEKRQAEREEKE